MRNNRPHQSHLPRLDPKAYRGLAMIHWTHTFEEKATGWLDDRFHHRFRELLLHAAARNPVACPVYCLMPDHIHTVWCGLSPSTDQRTAIAWLRAWLKRIVKPAKLQPQPHDHILDQYEAEGDAFEQACFYVWQNPVRAGLVGDAVEWKFTGTVVLGYPDLHPRQKDFREDYWKLYRLLVAGRKECPPPSVGGY